MAKSTTFIDEIGEVTIVRRRGLKYLSIRIDHGGMVRLNLPWYVPKATGLLFLAKKHEWIKQQQSKKVTWTDGHEIYGVKLKIEETDKTKSSSVVKDNELIIRIPKELTSAKKKKAVDKLLSTYLKNKTEEVIVPKAIIIAREHNYKPGSFTVKKLKSRWGSCDHKGHIKLSLYLYCLPEELWRYVVCHELAHLKELNHSQKFWTTVETMYPDYKNARKLLKTHSPGIFLP